MYKDIDTINTYTTTTNYNFKKIKKVTTKSKAERVRLFNPEAGWHKE